MAADIKAPTIAFSCAGDSTHDIVGLNDEGCATVLAELVGSGQSSGTRTDHHDLRLWNGALVTTHMAALSYAMRDHIRNRDILRLGHPSRAANAPH